jgi:hypothetical protein
LIPQAVETVELKLLFLIRGFPKMRKKFLLSIKVE